MITFDPAKDAANFAKHGVSLALAEEMDLDEALIVADTRENYGEPRFNAYGPIGGLIFAFTFTIRAGRIRAISLRRCREKEARKAARRP